MPVTEVVYRTASLKASEINWESPCTKEIYGLWVRGLAWVLAPTKVLPWFRYPSGLCPHGCSGASMLRFPWETLTWVWAVTFAQAPHLTELARTSFLPKSPSSLEEISHQIQQSHWAPQTGCTGSVSQENGTKKRFLVFTQLEESIKHRTATNFLSFFPYMMLLLQQMEFRTGSLNQIICSHRKPLHIAHLIINISAPQFNKIMGTLLNLFNLKQLLLFNWLQLAFHKTKDMLMCLTKRWFNKRCNITFYKFHYAKGK